MKLIRKAYRVPVLYLHIWTFNWHRESWMDKGVQHVADAAGFTVSLIVGLALWIPIMAVAATLAVLTYPVYWYLDRGYKASVKGKTPQEQWEFAVKYARGEK